MVFFHTRLIFIFIDFNDPDYIKELLRPASIKEDVKLMEQRRRVTLILQSPAFRNELEKIIASQMRDGVLSPNVMALKRLVDLLTPHAKLGSSAFAKSIILDFFLLSSRTNTFFDFFGLQYSFRCYRARYSNQ